MRVRALVAVILMRALILAALSGLPLAASRAVVGSGVRLLTPPIARAFSPVRCDLGTIELENQIEDSSRIMWAKATRGTDVLDRGALREVLDSYGVTSGTKSILKAYDDSESGDLTYEEFRQLVAVLEASRLRDERALTGKKAETPYDEPNYVGGRVGEAAYNTVSSFARLLIDTNDDGRRDREERGVSVALRRMQRDMSMLDQAAGSTPQLSNVELVLLSSAVVTAFCAPLAVAESVVEVLVPSCAALAAAIGFSAEYAGKVAVSKGKEIAATTLQAAAEAELYLAQAERGKAIIPLCVGFSATAAAFALLVPQIAIELAARGISLQFVTEIYLVCPIASVLAAAVAALAAQETTNLASRAMSVGARRFASSSDVGRTWLSATEQISASTARSKEKWRSFSVGVLPAPLLGVLCPGALSFKCIVAAAVAAAQCAYSLARAEYTLAAAVESVALKSRTAAVSDTYANQGARAGAILPFTSALSGLCAATTVAVVEALPLVQGITLGQSFLCVTFPAFGALIAAAASISKARCEVDAEAATAAATALAETDEGTSRNNPIRATIDLVRLTVRGIVLDARRRPSYVVRWVVNSFRKLIGLPPRYKEGPIATRPQRSLVV